jgi:hypothetical protein
LSRQGAPRGRGQGRTRPPCCSTSSWPVVIRRWKRWLLLGAPRRKGPGGVLLRALEGVGTAAGGASIGSGRVECVWGRGCRWWAQGGYRSG